MIKSARRAGLGVNRNPRSGLVVDIVFQRNMRFSCFGYRSGISIGASRRAVQRAVLNGFADVARRDCFFASQICNGAGDLQNAV